MGERVGYLDFPLPIAAEPLTFLTLPPGSRVFVGLLVVLSPPFLAPEQLRAMICSLSKSLRIHKSEYHNLRAICNCYRSRAIRSAFRFFPRRANSLINA